MNYTVGFGLMAIGLLLGISGSISQIRNDIKRINTNVNRIAKQVGVPDTVTDELKGLLLEGERIKAIKKYREVTGFGLVEAKEYVDSLKETELK
ncbi:ribosomal protein L7/L12 [Clostridium estertheticum]|uniref:ribosomal protein L7/L12 n=1 Tax=Clostridium estertheticum TaxID=238834 RepID=UPI001CF567A9|nr:ribosomal protein L7/L12 [Clostridium estertheticum]MCB2340183.1 ribosomal protein L7/L12 [Clostridium estertheticum]